MRLRFLPLVVLGVGALSGCEDALSVQNPNNPDVSRILSMPDGIEGLLRASYQQVLTATHGSSEAVWPAAQVLAGESYATVANFGMTVRAAIPRQVISNDPGNVSQTGNLRDFSLLHRNARNIARGIDALDALVASGGTLGSDANNLRARAFGFFSLGVALGNVSLIYDSVAVPRLQMAAADVPELVHYSVGMQSALDYLDSALVIAATPAAAGLNIPVDWLRLTDAPVNRDRFVRIVRSYKARYRAGVARNPAEREAVNWNLVVDDAAAGIESNLTLNLSQEAGWNAFWINQALVQGGWSILTPLYIGMADTSGNYRQWIAIPFGQARTPPLDRMLIHTPDTRFPAGATRAAQTAASPPTSAVLPSIYFAARAPGQDTPGDPWGISPYDFVRFQAYRQQNLSGPWVVMSVWEIRMLQAEGLLRTNRAAQAVPLINASRTANGLPAFPDGATASTPAPQHPGGGAFSCVPQTPRGPSRTVECGTLFEAMKYEKRIETMFTGYAQWLVDSRGWGDLVEGTAVQWPVPFQELQARYGAAFKIYNSQGPAGAGTYGF